MITAKRKDWERTRNSSFFKNVDDCITVQQEADDDDDVALESSPPTAATVDQTCLLEVNLYRVREEHQSTSKIMFSSA